MTEMAWMMETSNTVCSMILNLLYIMFRHIYTQHNTLQEIFKLTHRV